ncbi:MAG: hypothetical protein IKZ47_00380 [Clostridia bacterium]|nr:hypothetical protein [Clostridia bacterium]
MTDFGCFYTPQKFVDKLIEMVKTNVDGYAEYTYLDSSCGYGAFLKSLYPLRTIGCDIDEKAIEKAEKFYPNSKYYNLNALSGFTRDSINLNDSDKLIIIGNPPYNDTTSRVKNDIKKAEPCVIDDDIKTRDLGISFLLSYNKLKPDYIAVLHPLSYMIKKANYDLLKPFYNNYTLIDHCIVNSQEFSMTSKSKGFPIILAIYKKSKNVFKYSDVLGLNFITSDNKSFNLKHDYIRNYISKYPSKYKKYTDGDVLFFTMRDINALNRSRTFIEELSDNSIIIDKNKIAYYCYVDVFKDHIDKLPYYYGNCDVFINNSDFLRIKDVFITKSVQKHPWLKSKISYNENTDFDLIDNYFKKLFQM